VTPALVRTGIGYDSHRFAEGGPIILAGVTIASPVHLTGHSDADAVCHAVTDALLGAAGAGDIGEMFPDSDPANAGRNSVEMLSLALERATSAGWRVSNVDVTIVAQRPRIQDYRAAMIERLAGVLRVDRDQVSIKGKTNEGMGWIGRGEGLACIAVATLCRADN
jgi:2-C-methyl-D-erythritol 2,4-cyclodiphosphate synthase